MSAHRIVHEFLTKCHVFYVATVEEGGQPRVRPFGAHLLIDDVLYFQTGQGRSVHEQMSKNPRIEICSYVEREWIRITGEVEFVDDDAIRAAMFAAAPERARSYYKLPKIARRALLKKVPGLKNMVDPEGDPLKNGAPFRLRNATAGIYSLKDETRYYVLD
ncbi:MAG TPA: NimC/NimA family protein [Coriobacteriia bacterium]|nr:NimC/NimA family protein [Coriobacteriia bacterium]